MSWTPLTFGKYAGKTLPQILFSDPPWFFCAMRQGAFENQGALSREAREIFIKARRIRIRQNKGHAMQAEYTAYHSYLCVLKIVPRDDSGGRNYPVRRNVIDLNMTSFDGRYDKVSGRILLQSVKFCLFNDQSYRMSRKRSEDFFDDASNFRLKKNSSL
jgi:hypothetical protein